jgi:hypothetical protein
MGIVSQPTPGCAPRRDGRKIRGPLPISRAVPERVTHTARDPDFEARVRASFARQAAMATIGAEIAHLAPGEVDLRMPYRAELTQQHGFMHAGIVGTLADSACGYAAYTLMPADAAVLSVEYKLNLLAPPPARPSWPGRG